MVNTALKQPEQKYNYIKKCRQRLMCPKCGYRVIDAGESIISELHVMMGKHDSWSGDYFSKCDNCKSVIGIKKVK